MKSRRIHHRNGRHTHKNKHHGGRGAFTTGASQELYQMTGQTPGLSSGGGGRLMHHNRRRTMKNRNKGHN